jgi:phosphatidylserine/phosphatidylglycerophosphate/cardiolipin synthase-like enzyme
MANVTITGEVLDSGTQVGVPMLVVGAYDRGVFGEVLIPNTTNTSDALFPQYARTASDGTFTITLPAGTYDLHVRVLDTVRRELAHVPVVDDGPPIDVGTINLTSAEIGGYLATGGAFPSLIDGTDVELLVDNHDAWSRILDAVKAATTTIEWMLFYLDIGLELMTFSPDQADPGAPVQGESLEAALKDAAATRNVQVRLACNQLTATIAGATLKFPYPANTAGHVQSYFQGVTNVEVRPMLTPGYAPIHTKFVVIDNAVGFVIGSPFVADYYDADTHLIDDARHGTFSSFLPDSHGIQVPTHDVSIQVKGSALAALNETFRLHWNTGLVAGAGGILGPAPAPQPEAANVGVQVVRSLAGNERYDDFPHGEASILESYLRAIGQATDYIYLENQYFTSNEIADALVLRIKQSPTLQVIFLTNNKVDIPGYKNWHPATIKRVLLGLDATDRQRVGFFTIWSHEAITSLSDATHICRNYVHSKVAIIDDRWVTVGSANLDGDSLLTSDNAARGGWWALGWALGLRSDGVVEENRESETNVVILDGIAGGTSCGLAKQLRQQLWAEHLYSSAPDTAPAAGNLDTAPAGGWLSLWTTAAQQKLDLLKQSVDTLTVPARVLAIPYDATNPDIPSKISDPKKYLKLAGMDPDTIVVRDTFRRFDWAAGNWVDAWEDPDG